MADEQVRFDILINAKAAIQELRQMSQEATSVQERVANFSLFLIEKSRQWNVPVQQLLNTFRQLNAEMAKQKTQTIFGNQGGQNIFNLSGQFLQAAQSAGRFTTNANGVVQSVRNVDGSMGKAASTVKRAWGEFELLGSRVNLVRTAFGTLEAIAIFKFFQILTELISGATEQFTQLEDSLWRVTVAEKSLSDQGVEITTEGLKKGIQDIKKLLPIFSEQDIAGLVGKVSISTKELGYTEEQILSLAKAISVLNVVSTENEDLNQTATKVITALLSGTTKGISGLGVQLNDTVIKTKAIELGFLDAGESLDKLTKEERDFTKLQIVLGTANDSLGLMNDYLGTNAAKVKANAAGWDDLKTAVGGFTSSVIPGFTNFFQVLIDIVNMFKVLVVVWDTGTMAAIRFFNALATGQGAVDAVRKGVLSLKDIPKVFDEIAKKEVPSLFAEVPANAPDWFKNIFGKYLQDVDTATNLTAKFQNELDDFNADEFKNKVDDILADAANAREDLDKKLSEKLSDLDTEYQRKALDAEKDYNRKVADINKDAERDLAKLKDKQRADDLKAEENYQNKLWELRMRYLMDLEDALHARDARQVIRLQKQYEIDKEALARKQGLDDKQRAADHKAEQEDIELKRQQRLEDAKLEYSQKLADQRLAKQRELDDLNVWYAREQKDIETNIQRKLEALIRGWVQEKKITEQSAAEVYGILYKYFGPGGLTDQLTQYMASQLKVPVPTLGIPTTTTSPTGGSIGSRNMSKTTTAPRRFGGEQFAEGGTLIATRPTTATFGEAGAEMVTFTPLSRIGQNAGKVFSSGSASGLNGQITVALNLSPDLEARVVENSVNGVADVLLKVNRTKL